MRIYPPVSYLARERTPSRIGHYFFYCSLLLIVIISFYPFTGWFYNRTDLFAFFFYPLPHYYTLFDNSVNVMAYIPTGFFLARMLRKKSFTWLRAILLCALISASIEFIQQFLPNRVSSNLDILSNSAGAALGCLFAHLYASRRLKRLYLFWRHSALAPGLAAEWGLVWMLLWFISQLDPSQPFLSVVVVPRGLPQPYISPIENATFFLNLLEGGGMMLNLIGVAFFVSLLARRTSQAPKAIFFTLIIALMAKLFFASMLLKREQFFSWLNLNILVGGIAGSILIFLLWRLNQRARAFLALITLAGSQIISWMWPLSPQYSATLALFRWNYGHLSHFNGLTSIISDIWPIGAMLWLAYILIIPIEEDSWI